MELFSSKGSTSPASQGYKTIKDAVLFAIDINPSMLARPPPSEDKKAEKDSPASAALKCAYQLMQQRIISNPHDMMGILLLGTQQSKFQGEDDSSKVGLTYPHCYLLADLDVPSAVDVKRLKNLIDDEEEASKLLIPSEEPVSMANALFCANQIFTTKAPNFSSRRLFLVTDNDNPHGQDKALRSAAAVRAKDLYDLGVIIELFPISRPDHEFNRATFYDVRGKIVRIVSCADFSRTSCIVRYPLIRTRLLPSLRPPSHLLAGTVSVCSSLFSPPSTPKLLHAEPSSLYHSRSGLASKYLSRATSSSNGRSQHGLATYG